MIILMKMAFVEKPLENLEPVSSAVSSSHAGSSSTVILILGDSLTEGYGVDKLSAFPALVENSLKQKYPSCSVKIINGGISGSTSASALGRLKGHFKQMPKKPDVVLLALGANDGLRVLPVEDMKQNLQTAIDWLMNNKTQVILAGMRIPPNYGFKYSRSFEQAFIGLAKKNKITFIPFLLKGVAMQPKLNLPDGIHPNEQGHKAIARTVFPYLKNYCS